jgi:hypothetical protein
MMNIKLNFKEEYLEVIDRHAKKDKANKHKVIFRHGHIAITDYKMGDNFEFEKKLSQWDEDNYKYNMIIGYYYKDKKELRLPRGFSPELIHRFFAATHKFELDNKCWDYDRFDYKLKHGPKSDIQIVALAHMIGAAPYEENKKYSSQLIYMDTGEGKSYSYIATLAYFGVKTVLSVHRGSIKDQWTEYFLKHCYISKDKIIHIDGSKGVEKLLHGDYDHCAVFIFITNTLENQLTQYGPKRIEQILKKTKAGLLGFDEIHKWFKFVMQISSISNIRKQYYLTATPNRSDGHEDALMKRAFSGTPKTYGLKTLEENHINVIVKYYSYTLSKGSIRYCAKRKGLNAMLYENMVFKYGADKLYKAMDFVFTFVDHMNVNKNKVLILTSTTAGVDTLYERYKELYPNKNVTRNHGKLPKAERDKYKNGDIIIATEKSAGEAENIEGLQFMLNIVSYSNKIGAKQYKGRLREIPGDEVYYFEFVNNAFSRTKEQFQNREKELKKTAKGGDIVYLP